MVWRAQRLLFSLAVMVDAFALAAHSAVPAPSAKILGLSGIDHPVAIPQRERQWLGLDSFLRPIPECI